MRARSRQVAHDQAELLADMAEVAHCADADLGRLDEAFEYASMEIRAALSMTRRAAEAELAFATEMRELLPMVWLALSKGRIDARRARVIVEGTEHLPRSTAIDVAGRVLEQAPGLTTGQLRARLQRLCMETDPEEAKTRYEDVHEGRRITSRLNPEGTAHLHGLDLAPHRVAEISCRIQHLARGLKQSGDSRTMDQIRADVFVDLLLGNQMEGNGGGVITMTAPIDTLAGLSERTAHIPGLGPVVADVARQVLSEHPDADLRFRITAPGGIVVGTPSRRASRTLRRFVETRDETCVAPGCRMPAAECDIDHRQRWVDGGPTNNHNTQPLCRHDHQAKDDGGWALQSQDDGTYLWTSPLGHTYVTSGRSP